MFEIVSAQKWYSISFPWQLLAFSFVFIYFHSVNDVRLKCFIFFRTISL
jgi:hypothetical protein